jgi:hypothetical protein
MPREFSTLRHILLISIGVRSPSVFFQRSIHLINVLKRWALLCVGSTLIFSQGIQCVPGLVSQPYMAHLWTNTTGDDWKYNRLPGLQTVVAPGDAHIVIVWYSVVICLFICDLFRCVLVFSNKWFTEANHLDMSWVAISWTVTPALFASIAMLLDTHDLLVICLIFTLTACSGMCGFIIESLRCTVNPHTIVGMPQNLLYTLRVAEDGLLLVAAEIVLIPFTVNLIHNNGVGNTAHLLMALLFIGLTFTMWMTTYQHNSMCNRFERRWPGQTSLISWDTPWPIVSDPCETDEIQARDVVVIPDSDTTEYSIVRVDLVYDTDCNITPSKPLDFVKHGCMGSRAGIGQLTEWRRYYIVSSFFDMLLLFSILMMTGVVEICNF